MDLSAWPPFTFAILFPGQRPACGREAMAWRAKSIRRASLSGSGGPPQLRIEEQKLKDIFSRRARRVRREDPKKNNL